MKNSQKGFITPIILVVIALLVIGGGVYIYEKNIKTEAPIVVNNPSSGISNPAPVTASSASCGNFVVLSDFVLKNIQQPDSQKVMQMNPNVITSFHWKRNTSEPFITYPIMNGVEAYYGDDKANHSIDFTVSAIKKDSDFLSQTINTEAKNLGLSANSINTLPLQSFSNQDVTQTFAFEKDGSLYSVALIVDSGDHQAPPQGVVRITCGKALDNYNKVYNALNLKANSSVKDAYNNDYTAIGDVSSDNTVYAILGSSNQVNIANYYYFDGSKLKLVSKDSYPAECATLESQKVGLGMRCADVPSYNQRTVTYTNSNTPKNPTTASSSTFTVSSPTVNSHNQLSFEYYNMIAIYYKLTFNCGDTVSATTNKISGELCGTTQKIFVPANFIPVYFVATNKAVVSVTLDSYSQGDIKIDSKSLSITVNP